jgi:hypothetical protein
MLTSVSFSRSALADSDYDLYGVYKNYNTDNSREAGVGYDYGDDEVWKMFYIGYHERSRAHYVHLWVYGKSFGTPHETTLGYSHKIIIYNNWYPSGKSLYTFYSFEKFDTDTYHWQRFELPIDDFKPAEYNRIEIFDADVFGSSPYHGWQINNLRIGVDQSFEYIEDFDHSYFYSEGAGLEPDDPRDNEGELMIALELVDIKFDDHAFPTLQSGWDYHMHAGWNDWVPLDDSNDKAMWRTDLSSSDLAACSYARLFVYGAAWSSDESSETTLSVKVNGLNTFQFSPMKDFGFCRPIGSWSWIDIDVDNLNGGEENTFYFWDPTSHTHTNIMLAMFPYIDYDQSRWKYKDGTGWHGSYDYEDDWGELGVYLVLYNDVDAREDDRTVYLMELSNPWAPAQTEPYKNYGGWLDPETWWLTSCLESYDGWEETRNVQQDYENPGAFQGQIYDENYDSRGDLNDFVVISGHGIFEEFQLQLWGEDVQDPRSFRDKESFRGIRYYGYDEGYTEAEYYPYSEYYFSTKGQDGFNYNTEWLLLISCDVLGKSSGGSEVFDEESAFRTLIYHSLHTVMGYYSDFSLPYGWMLHFAIKLYDYLTWGGSEDPLNVIDAFIETSDFFDEPWAYFTHENNRYDYLWDEGSTSRDRDFLIGKRFENKDDIDFDYEGS